MSGTALHTQLTAATTTTTSSDALQPPLPSPDQSWTCNDCSISFSDGEAHRMHLKDPWHIYNIKRQIASLPPISLATFKAQIQTEYQSLQQAISEESEGDTEPEVSSPRQCLFCQRKFPDDTEDLQATLKHMSSHGFFVLEKARISDVESFLGYLAIEVREWHECLYCGTTRNSTLAIQSHMRDRGHCKLNLEREPELLEFWEGSSLESVARPMMRSGNELAVLPTGASTSRAGNAKRAKAARSRDKRLALRTPQPEPLARPPPPMIQSCRQLARRDHMGIQNVGPQQRQALALAVKRSQKEEAVASRASELSYARKANRQKHDQALGPLGRKAKAGSHNLLPR